MKDFGFVTVASASPLLKVADTDYNTEQIKLIIDAAIKKNVEILVFPELCITGYTCQDLFLQQTLLLRAEQSILDLCAYTKEKQILIAVGIPVIVQDQLFNCAALIENGVLLGIVPKTHLPNYSEFYEKRWFVSSYQTKVKTIEYADQTVPFGTDIIFCSKAMPALKIGVEICEDLWSPIPPSSFLALEGANIILNLSASNEVVGKTDYRRRLIEQQSARSICGYVYASSGFGESTTDVVYGGHCLIFENGSHLAESDRFKLESNLIISSIDVERLVAERLKANNYNDLLISPQYDSHDYRYIPFATLVQSNKLHRFVNPHPFVPNNPNTLDQRCEEIFHIQTSGLAKRLTHIGCKSVVVGISGGLDSTLALLVCVKTFDYLNMPRKNIIGVTMPGFGTTDRTYNNAIDLMNKLGITIREISIKEAALQHFKDIGHQPDVHDITYENTQARERTQILMDVSNQVGGIVVGTGDLSELALGWATYNGDHMSMYGVNGSIPKTLVKTLVHWIANHELGEHAKEILLDILDTPVSPELLPPSENGEIQQITEEKVGPYELHDFYLYQLLRFGFTPKKIYFLATIAFKDRYDNETILKWLKVFYKRFFSQQFKRSCLPDGPKVGSICLSPRGDFRMPSDASVAVWLKDLEKNN